MSRWWRIYYSEEVFTSDDGSPWEAPRTDVQIITQKHDEMGVEIISSANLYYYEEARYGFYPVDPTGSTFWDHLIRAPHPLILMGRMVSSEEYNKLCLKVLAELPEPKTLWRHGRPNWLEGD